jgi:beta-N-acetylhexosaminidase
VPFRAAVDAGVQAVMTGHLLVPALDPDLPATLSRHILTELLREELRFSGVVVTDAVEMRAVADRYGFAGSAVRALAAGADAICVGGERADEATVGQRDAIVAAVHSGELPEGGSPRRPSGSVARRLDRRRPVPDARPGKRRRRRLGGRAGRGRRAVPVTTDPAGATALPLTGPAYVVEFEPPQHRDRAGGPVGIGDPLAACSRYDHRPARRGGRARLDPAAGADGRPLVLVVRDLHRHDWMRAAVQRALAARPDAVVVELGLPVLVAGRVHVATHGATRAGARAAAELLTGAR